MNVTILRDWLWIKCLCHAVQDVTDTELFTLFHIRELTDACDWLMSLWLTWKGEYAPPSEKVWIMLLSSFSLFHNNIS